MLDQLEEWVGTRKAMTAGVKFLSAQRYGWDESEQTHYRADLLTFGAQWDSDTGIDSIRILTLE